jgi:hypothetical protein
VIVNVPTVLAKGIPFVPAHAEQAKFCGPEGADAQDDAHVALVAAPQLPLVHAKVADPVVGALLSVAVELLPEETVLVVALQVLDPTDQVTT